jgi:hypothetical protein
VREYFLKRIALDATGGVEHDNRLTTELVQNLPACPARKAGCGVWTHDGHETYLTVVRIGVGDHPGNGVSFGTDREPVRSVFDVASRIDAAISGHNRRTYPEVAVRSISFGRSNARSLD